MQIEKISEISINDTFADKIFITFDLDWCSDEILYYTLDIVEKYDIKGTFFDTHSTPLLERMRENPNIELGIHPNYNLLLQGDFSCGKNYQEVTEYFIRLIPEAVSVRSHSQTQNSNLLSYFENIGLKYDCNTFIPYSSGISLNPYRLWTGKLIKVPYFWEDDVHCLYGWQWDVEKFIAYKGLKVFDFHPIHVFLNTDKIEIYENNKKNLLNYSILKAKRNTHRYGTYNFLIDLVERGLRG